MTYATGFQGQDPFEELPEQTKLDLVKAALNITGYTQQHMMLARYLSVFYNRIRTQLMYHVDVDMQVKALLKEGNTPGVPGGRKELYLATMMYERSSDGKEDDMAMAKEEGEDQEAKAPRKYDTPHMLLKMADDMLFHEIVSGLAKNKNWKQGYNYNTAVTTRRNAVDRVRAMADDHTIAASQPYRAGVINTLVDLSQAMRARQWGRLLGDIPDAWRQNIKFGDVLFDLDEEEVGGAAIGGAIIAHGLDDGVAQAQANMVALMEQAAGPVGGVIMVGMQAAVDGGIIEQDAAVAVINAEGGEELLQEHLMAQQQALPGADNEAVPGPHVAQDEDPEDDAASVASTATAIPPEHDEE